MRADLETKESHQARIEGFAEKAFAEHEIAVVCDIGDVKVYKCRKPGTWIYGFFVSILPGAILVHGDVGDLLIDRPSGGLDWLLKSVRDMHYLLGKSAMAREDRDFMPGDAVKALEDVPSEYEKLEVLGRWNYEDDWDVFADAYYDATGDPDIPDCRYFSSGTLWCYYAIRWFAENLKDGSKG